MLENLDVGKNVTRPLQNAQLKGKPTEGEWFSNAHAFAMLSSPGGVSPIQGRTVVRGCGHRLRCPGATWR